MRLIHTSLILFLLSSTAACHTPIQVKAIDSVGEKWTDGVPFYLPKRIKRSFRLTKLDRNGVIVGVAPTGCEEVTGEEYLLTSDVSQMYMIRSDDFFFGQNTFGVSLDDGMLTNVNSVRDPQVDEMIGAVVEAAGSVGTLLAGIPAPRVAAKAVGVPDCNAGKRYTAPLP